MNSQNKLLTLWHGWRPHSRSGWRICRRTCPPGAGRRSCWGWLKTAPTGGLNLHVQTAAHVRGETHSCGTIWSAAMVSCAGGTPAASNAIGAPPGMIPVSVLVPRPRPPERSRGTRRRPGKPSARRRSRRKSRKMCSSGPRGWPRPQMPLGWKMRHPSSSQSMDGA